MKYIVIKDDKLDAMAETIVSNIVDAMSEEELALLEEVSLMEEIHSEAEKERYYELEDKFSELMYDAIENLNEYLAEEIVSRAFGIIMN